jgi:hypothetical protein
LDAALITTASGILRNKLREGFCETIAWNTVL